MNNKYEDALDVRVDSYSDGSVTTVRGYLQKLLETLWIKNESFSGKRPFGNGGWEFDLYKPLIDDGFISGSINSDGYIERLDTVEAHHFVLELIRHIFATNK